MSGDNDPTSLSTDWAFNNPNDLTNPSSNPIWDHYHNHHPTSSQNLDALCDMNMQNNATTSSPSLGFWKGNLVVPPRNLDICLAPTDIADIAVKRGGMFLPPAATAMLPHSLSQFPADSGFIERAARLSSFSAGNFEDVINNPFGNVHESSLSPYHSRSQVLPQEGFVGNGFKLASGEGCKEMPQSVDCGTHDGRQGGSSFSVNNVAGETEFSGGWDENFNEEIASKKRRSDLHQETEFSGGWDENSNEEIASKKRRSDLDSENNQVKQSPRTPIEVTMNNDEGKQKGENNPSSVNKSSGKHGMQVSLSSDAPKEEYIHVRAQRGQATNSHSLAERVRREKISERMKFLQDLVPGCSKVTGKAVMLDEIINYVQSLQRQVEFLSMKLATVNPRMDFNLEGLLSKDILESRLGSSGSLGYGADMAMPYTPIQSQMAIMQGGISSVGRPKDAVRRTVNSHLMSISGGFKDPASHVPGPWDDELHNIVQMGLDPSTSVSSRNIESTPPNHLKTEP